MKFKRKALSKKTRFEVFKRDSFMCQYCGESAPDVILHCDHIVPVKEGGDNSILNLVTASGTCYGIDNAISKIGGICWNRKHRNGLKDG